MAYQKQTVRSGATLPNPPRFGGFKAKRKKTTTKKKKTSGKRKKAKTYRT
jgi:hypothetical protein